MRKAQVFLMCLQMAVLTIAYGQTMDKNDADLGLYEEIPKESVFIHYNSGVLFSGETLCYKLYCLNQKKGGLSSLSKIAYVELVGADQSFVFKHKIKLDSGEGQGDFFIPVSVPSGNYKLVGYTRWMKNEGVSSFFQGDVTLINPYEKNRRALVVQEPGSAASQIEPKAIAADKMMPIRATADIALSIKETSHKKKDKISLSLSSSNGTMGYGRYSLSVRKVDTLTEHFPKTARSFISSKVKSSELKEDTMYLPELRGELISGNVTSKKTGRPVPNIHVSISIPGRAYLLDIVASNTKGDFFFNLDRDYDSENAMIQVLGDKEDISIRTDNHSAIDPARLKFAPFRIDPKMKALIEQRSIHCQIENAYSEIRQDSVVPSEATYPFFYDKNFDVFDLDAYTRFPSITETFVEVIQHASVRKTNGNPEFSVLPSNPQLTSFAPPLVVVDGILLQDHKALIEYGAKNIKRILVFRERYFYGAKGFQGALVFETLNSDYSQRMDASHTHTVALFKPRPKKEYFTQAYETLNSSASNHIPDYRHQLLWKPDVIFDMPEMTIDFFTSDVSGTFEIRLEGFTDAGKPVSLYETLSVK